MQKWEGGGQGWGAVEGWKRGAGRRKERVGGGGAGGRAEKAGKMKGGREETS